MDKQSNQSKPKKKSQKQHHHHHYHDHEQEQAKKNPQQQRQKQEQIGVIRENEYNNNKCYYLSTMNTATTKRKQQNHGKMWMGWDGWSWMDDHHDWMNEWMNEWCSFSGVLHNSPFFSPC